jgi:hypothetical protein
MTSHYTWGSVTTLHDFGGVVERPLDTYYWALKIPGSWPWLLCKVALIFGKPCGPYRHHQKPYLIATNFKAFGSYRYEAKRARQSHILQGRHSRNMPFLILDEIFNDRFYIIRVYCETSNKWVWVNHQDLMLNKKCCKKQQHKVYMFITLYFIYLLCLMWRTIDNQYIKRAYAFKGTYVIYYLNHHIFDLLRHSTNQKLALDKWVYSW